MADKINKIVKCSRCDGAGVLKNNPINKFARSTEQICPLCRGKGFNESLSN